MDILVWIIIGLVAGILAKMLTPGTAKEPKGCLLTIALGIAGSLVVGFIMQAIFGTAGAGGFIPTVIGATIGAILLILLMRRVWA